MPTCAVCEQYVDFPYTCNYCGRQHCGDHRLPENHRCPGLSTSSPSSLKNWINYEKRFARIRDEVRGTPSTPPKAAKSASESGYSARQPPKRRAQQEDDLNRFGATGTPSEPVVLGDDTDSESLLFRVFGRLVSFFWMLIGLFIALFLLPIKLLRAAISPGRVLVLVLVAGVLSTHLIASGAASATDLLGPSGESVDEMAHAGNELARGIWLGVTNASSQSGTELSDAPEETVTAASDSGGVSSGQGSDDLDRTQLERYIHDEVNEHRQAHGLSELDHDSALRQIARDHAAVMAAEGALFHTQPDGDTMEDRYRQAGYECRVPTGSNTYATGGENVAQTWYQVNVISERGTDRYETPEELAEGVVNQWMNSTGHRENILQPYWRNQGIGVAVIEQDGSTAVYVTQNFC